MVFDISLHWNFSFICFFLCIYKNNSSSQKYKNNSNNYKSRKGKGGHVMMRVEIFRNFKEIFKQIF